jgi:hypothetical protein
MSIQITERLENSFLGHTVVAEFEYVIAGSPPGEAEVQLWHTGSLRRTGVDSRVKDGQTTVSALVDRLVSNEKFVQAILPLDFKTFYLLQDEGGWRAKTSQVGAAWVTMAFPPVRRYIPLGSDQVEALIATFNQLQVALGS